MSKRGLNVLLVVMALFGSVLIALWPHSPPRQSVVLIEATNYVAGSSNLTSFCISNSGPRAILLTDLIVETQSTQGWRPYSHSVPTYPQRLDVRDIKEVVAGLPLVKGHWRFRVSYGTDVKGPALEISKAFYAITHFHLTGPGFGVMAGSNWIASSELPEPTDRLPSEPEIVGTAAFSNQVFQAVRLLRHRDLESYRIVTNYVGRIKESERSGMWAATTPPTYEMSDKTALYSLTWCAATIAHDSFHSKLYHDYQREHAGPVPDQEWTGVGAERQCMSFQLRVMEQIGAPGPEVEHAKAQEDGHYVKDGETWQDYQKRSW